jgi:cytochrome bd-type quinol oxidase subunit 1
MNAEILSRIQFALTASFHFLSSPIEIPVTTPMAKMSPKTRVQKRDESR